MPRVPIDPNRIFRECDARDLFGFRLPANFARRSSAATSPSQYCWPLLLAALAVGTDG